MLDQKKMRVCWGCRLHNCLLRQTLSNTHDIQRRFSYQCKGKQITFKELTEQVKKDQTAGENCSAQVKSPASGNDDSDSDDLANAFADMDIIQTTRNDEFGYKDYVT